MENNKLGLIWWLTLLLGIVLGFATTFGGMIAYNYFSYQKAQKDWFYSDKKLVMIPEVLEDNELFTIEMVSADNKESYSSGASMIYKLTNKTNDSMTFMSDYIVINGYGIGGSLYEEVPANQSKEAVMIVNDNLFDYDIEKITDVTISLTVNYINNDGNSEYKKFGPYTAKSEYKDYDQSKIDEKVNVGNLIYDENGIKITVLDNRYETDSYAPKQWLLVENLNDFTLGTGMGEIVINGITISNASFYTTDIAPNGKVKAPIILDMSDSEKEKIPTIETIEFYIDFHNYDEGFKVETDKLKVK